MMLQFYLLIISIIISSIYSKCNHYYQSSGPSSTKRPFDICYKSEIDNNLFPTSYRYYCIDSTPTDYGNNSVTGYTAFREDFNDINCLGKPNRTRIVNKPFRILCENDNPTCEILRFRQYPIINASSCTYNQSIYVEDIQVIAICKDEGDRSEATFCNKKSDTGEGSYFWSNEYYNGLCENDRLFAATYQFHGCQGDGSTFLEILQCDLPVNNQDSAAKPANNNQKCANYWQSNNAGASSALRPFDICYRSYRDSQNGDYSYRYICNETIVDKNYSINGYTVFKQFFNGIGCQGEPNATLLEDIMPYSIYCGGDDCDVVRYRVYDVYNSQQCENTNQIKILNDYQENIHVIQHCDDDGFISDSYFCADDYFSIASYNNDICNNDGIYAAQYYFEGCNDNGEYIEIVECQQPTQPPSLAPSISPTQPPSIAPSIAPSVTMKPALKSTLKPSVMKSSASSTANVGMIIGVIVGFVVVFCIGLGVGYFVLKRKMKKEITGIKGDYRNIKSEERETSAI